tara:strand:- start:291 stop:428 length:138 start_codon:yes stop_codon:yes gene_type:complete
MNCPWRTRSPCIPIEHPEASFMAIGKLFSEKLGKPIDIMLQQHGI